MFYFIRFGVKENNHRNNAHWYICSFQHNQFYVTSGNELNQNAMPIFNLRVNGKEYKADVAADTPLLWVLRDHLGLVGTKYGCGIAQCGACTVLLDGNAVRACTLPVSAIKTSKVITIEGLSASGDHPLQQAWDEVDVPQCGYCQAGQIMTAAALLKRKPKPTMQEIDEAMHPNICRCGAYHRIREAVRSASTKI
jgi:isoquinoline 1-oxidoreductase subunit alpha